MTQDPQTASPKFGYLLINDFVRPSQRAQYSQFRASLWQDLAPEGALEQVLAAEIIHATWRLQRCAAAESQLSAITGADSDETADDPLTDPMLDASAGRLQITLDRARAAAHRAIQRCTLELRRLQAERQARLDLLPDAGERASLGLAPCKDLLALRAQQLRQDQSLRKQEGLDSFSAIINQALYPESENENTKRTQSPPADPAFVPRGGPCPCGSGQKYKRCCGQNAEPLLCRAA